MVPATQDSVHQDPVHRLRKEIEKSVRHTSQTTRISALAQAFSDYLGSAGLVYTTEPGPVWIEKATGVAHPEGSRLHAHLAHRGGVAATAPEVIAALKSSVAAICYGEGVARPAKLVRLSAVGDDGFTYLRLSDTWLMRVHDSARVPNGTAGLVIPHGDSFEALPDELPPPSTVPMLPFVTALGPIRVQGLGVAAPWLLAFMFGFLLAPREAVRTRPMLTLIGPSGCGKSTIARILLWLLLGRKAEVMTPPDQHRQRDLQVALDGVPVAALDDPDPEVTWLASMLRALSTSAATVARKLYTDREQVHLDTGASLILTANGNPLPATPANMSRLVPLIFEPKAGELLSDGTLEERLHALRAQVWADAIVLLRAAEAARWGEGATCIRRLSRFETILFSMASCVQADTTWLRDAFAMIERTRHELVVEDDPLADALEAMAPAAPQAALPADIIEQFGLGGREREEPPEVHRTSAEILETLRYPQGRRDVTSKTGDGYAPRGRSDMQWDRTSAQSLGRRIAEIGPALLAVRGIEVTQAPRTSSRRGWVIRRLGPSGQ